MYRYFYKQKKKMDKSTLFMNDDWVKYLTISLPTMIIKQDWDDEPFGAYTFIWLAAMVISKYPGFPHVNNHVTSPFTSNLTRRLITSSYTSKYREDTKTRPLSVLPLIKSWAKIYNYMVFLCQCATRVTS